MLGVGRVRLAAVVVGAYPKMTSATCTHCSADSLPILQLASYLPRTLQRIPGDYLLDIYDCRQDLETQEQDRTVGVLIPSRCE